MFKIVNKGKIPFLVVPLPADIEIVLNGFQWEGENIVGDYTILGEFSKLTNKECSLLVHKQEDGIYSNYNGTLENAWDCHTSKQSLKSLLVSESLWLKNWMGKNPYEINTSTFDYDNIPPEVKDWQLYEEKKFFAPDDFLIVLINK